MQPQAILSQAAYWQVRTDPDIALLHQLWSLVSAGGTVLSHATAFSFTYRYHNLILWGTG